MSGLRVLVVEDHSDLLQLMHLTLARQDCVVIEAKDGQDAIEILEQAQPDVILSDLKMPRMDGLDLCQAVRTHVRYSEVPIVLLTAMQTSDDRLREALALPGVSLMKKPPRFGQLGEELRRLVTASPANSDRNGY